MAEIISREKLEKMSGGAGVQEAHRVDGSGAYVIFGKPEEIDDWYEFAIEKKLPLGGTGTFPGYAGSPVYASDSMADAQKVLDQFKEYTKQSN